MNTALLAAWLLSLMVVTIPPGTHQSANALETKQAQLERYEHIADAIATVALDPKEASVFASNAGGRVRTATLMLAVSYFESSWQKGVDEGTVRGDGGNSCTVFQLNLGKGKTPEGWSCDELAGDREKTARAALGALRRSAHECRLVKDPEALLYAYASGKCDGDAVANKQGETVREIVAKRLERVRRWNREHPVKAFAKEHPELLEVPRAPEPAGPGELATGDRKAA